MLEQIERQPQESDKIFMEYKEKRMKAEVESEEQRAAQEDYLMRMQQLFMQ